MYSSDSDKCYGTRNFCSASSISYCYRSIVATVECSKLQYQLTPNYYYDDEEWQSSTMEITNCVNDEDVILNQCCVSIEINFSISISINYDIEIKFLLVLIL